MIPVNHILFGVYGGIYRPVWLVATDPCAIVVNDCASPGVFITQKNVTSKSADVAVKVKVGNPRSRAPPPCVLKMRVYDSGTGRLVKTDRQDFTLTPQSNQSIISSFRISAPSLART